MADIVGSLFGLSVPELEAQQKQKQMEENQNYAMLMAKGSPAPGRTYNQMLLGRSLGQMLGKSLFGVQDPMIERATQLEGILKQTQSELGAEAQDPVKLYGTLSQKLGEAGFGREAAQALELGNKAKENAMDISYKQQLLDKSKADTAKENAALTNDTNFRKAIADLGPNPTAEQLASVAAQFGGPKEVMQNMQLSADKKEKLANDIKLKEMQIDADITKAREKNASDAEIKKMVIQGQLDIKKMMIANQQSTKLGSQVLTPSGIVAGKYDEKGNFQTAKGEVIPAKQMVDTRTKHDLILELNDKLENVNPDDINKAFNRNMDYTTSELTQYAGGKVVGKDVVSAQQRINQIKVTETLNALQTMKGSTSDKEMGVVLSRFPGFNAKPDAMNTWLKDAKAATTKYLEKNANKFGGDFTLPTVATPAPAETKTIPAAAIARLKANPKEASLFDAQFGAGSSAKVLGGK